MDEVFKQKWIAALKSGDYNQTRGILTGIDDEGNVTGCCCLGVACEIAVEEGLLDYVNIRGQIRGYLPLGETSEHNAETAVLPQILKTTKAIGHQHGVTFLVDFITHSLPELNDDGFTFDQIADLIEYFG